MKMSDQEKMKRLFDERNGLVEKQQRMLDTIERQHRDFTAEEESTYNKMDLDFEALSEQIEGLRAKMRINKLEFRKEYLGSSSLPGELKSEIFGSRSSRGGHESLSYDMRELCENVGNLAKGETRALQADKDSAGGWTLPLPVWPNIIHAANNATWIRKLARHWVIEEGREFGIPVLADDVSDPDFTSEIGESQEDTTMDFAQRALFPKRLTKFIKVSNTLLRQSAVDIGAFVTDRLLYKYRVAEESAFMTGTGAGEPLGIFTSSDAGVDSSRWISTGSTASQIKADGVINCMYNLKGQYLSSSACVWLLHRDGLKMLRKLKDGEGQFVWQAGLAGDRPSTILGKPYYVSEYVPNTVGTGLAFGCIADLNYYGIVDSDTAKVQILLEKYALTNQLGFLLQGEVDGAPLLPEAFSVLQFG